MKLICMNTRIQYHPDRPNHRTYLPPVEVLQHTIASNDKGKGLFYDFEDQPTKSLSRNIRHPQSRTTHEACSHASTEETTQARIMTDREHLISLHQKVDRN